MEVSSAVFEQGLQRREQRGLPEPARSRENDSIRIARRKLEEHRRLVDVEGIVASDVDEVRIAERQRLQNGIVHEEESLWILMAPCIVRPSDRKLPKALEAPKKSGACREASACCLGAPR